MCLSTYVLAYIVSTIQLIKRKKKFRFQTANMMILLQLRYRNIKPGFCCHLAWQSLVTLCWDTETPASRSSAQIHPVLSDNGVWVESKHYLLPHILFVLSLAPVSWTLIITHLLHTAHAGPWCLQRARAFSCPLHLFARKKRSLDA